MRRLRIALALCAVGASAGLGTACQDERARAAATPAMGAADAGPAPTDAVTPTDITPLDINVPTWGPDTGPSPH
ncbi:MAG: hypothetical protein U1F43_07180 [Myxococcota bacterium]